MLGEHLVRLVLEAPAALASTGVPDEWLALTVPGQFQTRYYTVRSLADGLLTIDVVVHEEGLVTGWAQTDCVGDTVGLSAPKGSFELPPDAGWVVLAGDLTALPAMARITETVTAVPVTVHAEAPDEPLPGYFAGQVELAPGAVPGTSGLAAIVKGLDWPDGHGLLLDGRGVGPDARHPAAPAPRPGPGHPALRRDGLLERQSRPAAAPGRPRPHLRARARRPGKSDDEIWADYDEAQRGRMT